MPSPPFRLSTTFNKDSDHASPPVSPSVDDEGHFPSSRARSTTVDVSSYGPLGATASSHNVGSPNKHPHRSKTDRRSSFSAKDHRTTASISEPDDDVRGPLLTPSSLSTASNSTSEETVATTSRSTLPSVVKKVAFDGVTTTYHSPYGTSYHQENTTSAQHRYPSLLQDRQQSALHAQQATDRARNETFPHHKKHSHHPSDPSEIIEARRPISDDSGLLPTHHTPLMSPAGSDTSVHESDPERPKPKIRQIRASSFSTTPPSQQVLFGVPLKYLSLLFLIFQNTSLVLQMKLSLLPSDTSSPRYIASTAVVMMEFVKCLVCLFVLYLDVKSMRSLCIVYIRDVLGKPRELMIMLVPAALYAIQNNLLFTALTHLEAAVFQVTYQLKILATAFFMVLLLGKRLKQRQWVALCLLMAGVAIVQLQSMSHGDGSRSVVHAPSPSSAADLAALSKAREDPSHPLFRQHERYVLQWAPHLEKKEEIVRLALNDDHKNTLPHLAVVNKTLAGSQVRVKRQVDLPIPTPSKSPVEEKVSVVRTQNKALGLLAVFLACLSSGFAGTYFEKVLKTSQTSLWIRNLQLSLFALLFSLLACLASDGGDIWRDGFFRGYCISTWFIVLNQAVGGLLVAIVVKYADNLLKGFSTCIALFLISRSSIHSSLWYAIAVSIVLSSILSIWLFDFHLSPAFGVGTGLVLYSAYLYSQ